MGKPPSNFSGPTDIRRELIARLSLFTAAIVPMTIWPLSDGILARPISALLWALISALFAASFPGRGIRLAAWIQLLFLPLTLTWVGTVAVTGAGPSNAVMDSATEGALREALTGARLALAKPSCAIVSMLVLASCGWALWATRGARRQQGNVVGIVFLCLLIPMSAVMLDGSRFQSFARIAGPEVRVAVVWLSHAGVVKEAVSSLLDRSATGSHRIRGESRPASAATKLFDAHEGLGVFILGESLRADALVSETRGPWSKALAARLREGLGHRLPDACAGANGTFASTPRLLTAVDIADSEGAATRPTLLALARAAGAKTAYINNQEIWVLPESGHDLLQKTSSMEMNAYDEVVIEALSDFTKRFPHSPKAALLHLYGAHFNYERRYPPQMFGPETPGLSGDALMELRYARAAEYGAHVLMLAAAVLDEQTDPAFLVFTSDHGENLPSDGTGKRYHTGPSSGKFDTTVPALVLWNKAFLKTNRHALLEPFSNVKGLIAHRDVAKVWLALEGMPGTVSATQDPQTWGAREPGQPVGAISCASLLP